MQRVMDSDLKLGRDNLLFHFATGGVSHFLRLLGHSIIFSNSNRVNVTVVTEHHNPLAKLPMSDVFNMRAPLVPLEFINPAERNRALGFHPTQHDGRTVIRAKDRGTHIKGELPNRIPLGLALRKRRLYTLGTLPKWSKIKRSYASDSAYQASLSALSLTESFKGPIRARASKLTEPYLGVHFRNTDLHNDLESTLNKVIHVAEEEGLNTIYWCTDDKSSIQQVQDRLRGYEVLHHQPFSAEGRNLHYGVRGEDAVVQLQNTLADLWTLSNSTKLITTSGSWGKLIPMLKQRDISEPFFGI